jgi:hypothetical protein
MHVPCPSGLVFSARSWKLGDHAKLIKAADKSMSQLPKIMVAMVSEEIIDPGPYEGFTEGAAVDWNKVTHADIVVANIVIRATKEPLLLTEFLCAVCRKLPHDPQEIDLGEIDIFQASDEGKAHLESGAPVGIEVGDARVKLKALRGGDLSLLGKLQLQEPEHMLELQACMGIAEINAPGFPQPFTTLHDIRKYWRDQGAEFRDEVDSATDALFGGADMRIRFTCDHIACRAEQEQSLPLGLTFYGLEDPKRHSRRAKCSTAKSVRELMQLASSRSSAKSPT